MGGDDSTEAEPLPRIDAEHPVVFFDGDCGLCHSSVEFTVRRDHDRTFRYAPLQGETFGRTLADPEVRSLAPFDPDHPPDSLIHFDGRRFLVRSRAVAAILRELGGMWPLLGRLLAATPRPLADAAYRALARVRHRLFSRPDGLCPLVPPDQRELFLD